MKLSVCIPVYNFDVNDLVNDLQNQIDTGNLDVDIILIDDASDRNFVEINKDLDVTVSQFIFLDKNIGRSKIRNLFLKYSGSEYLLFLDCDGKIISKDFLQTYFDFIEKHEPEVVYGGRKVNDVQPHSEYGLRWRFAVERENLPLKQRLRSPYLDFQTNNFIVKRIILEKTPFDEGITQYGYEDLIFSKDLYNNRIKVDHINNPIFNNDVETNLVFLSKADQSAKSLAELIKNDKENKRVSQIKLAKAYLFLRKTQSIFLYNIIYKLFKPYIRKTLLSGKGSLKVLDLYKLGQLIGYMDKIH